MAARAKDARLDGGPPVAPRDRRRFREDARPRMTEPCVPCPQGRPTPGPPDWIQVEAPVNATAAIAAPLLTMRGVVKRFGGVQALRGVDFDLKRGEIHALLGENGAGKSTLMNVLAGVFEPDGGEMLLKGAAVRFSDPRAAQAAGVATIFQELDLVPGLDVTANLFLGRELTRAAVLDRAAMRDAARERLGVGGGRHRRGPAGRRALGRPPADGRHRQGADLRVAHPGHGRADGRADRGRGRAPVPVMREIAARGVGIVYISHRLEEVPRVADRVTVMRDGQVAGVAPANAPQSELVRMLVGRPLDELYPKARDEFGKPVLRLEQARFAPRRVRAGWQAPVDISLEVRSGEIVGLAGIMGAGRTELLSTLYGDAGPGRWSGVVEIEGGPARLSSIRSSRARRASGSSPTTGAAAGSCCVTASAAMWL